MVSLCYGGLAQRDPLHLPRNIAGQSVRGADLYGREAELDLLWRKLGRGNVLLSAPRRYGKTSLMFALRDRPRDGWDVVYVNVEHAARPEEFAHELALRLAEAGSRSQRIVGRLKGLPGWFTDRVSELQAGSAAIGEVRLALRERAPADWRALVEPLWARVCAQDAPLVLILDEFPVMVDTFLEHDRAEALRFLHWFRALRQSGGHVLVGGSVNLEPRLAALGETALLNDLERMPVHPFAEDVAVAFVGAVLAEEKHDAVGLAERIVRRMGTGVPYFLQVYLDALLSEARRVRAAITPALIDAVYEEQLLGAACAGRFHHYLSRLRDYGLAETAARAALEELARGPMTVDALVDLARAHGLDAVSLRTRLESDWYIEVHGPEVRFADRFVQAWWRRNAPMGTRR